MIHNCSSQTTMIDAKRDEYQSAKVMDNSLWKHKLANLHELARYAKAKEEYHWCQIKHKIKALSSDPLRKETVKRCMLKTYLIKGHDL